MSIEEKTETTILATPFQATQYIEQNPFAFIVAYVRLFGKEIQNAAAHEIVLTRQQMFEVMREAGVIAFEDAEGFHVQVGDRSYTDNMMKALHEQQTAVKN